ncbi:MAG: RNA polymerase sigma factor for flagellar operon FliA [Nitrospirae bacterium]|nr:MAG: RNA polymerase sigma factor for flagellar operon FliA [Nitrospirota bacterium]
MWTITQEQKDDLVRQFLPRVKYYAGKYSFALPAGLSSEDLVSAGIIGLLEAIERFNPAMNASLSTFADFRIRGSMIDEIRTMQWASKDARRKLDEVRRANDDLQKELDRPATDEEIADRLDISLQELHKTQSTVNTLNMISLESLGVNQDGEHLDILQCLTNRDEPDMIDRLNLSEMKAALGNAIDALPEKERTVLTLYYYEELTMKEIGTVLGVTESRVCQLHGKALMKLRSTMDAFRA